MKGVFLDTDIIIDYLTDRTPYSESAEKVFALIENKKIRGHASSLCFSNLYYLLKQHMSRSRAIAILKSLSDILRIIKVDERDVNKALNSDFNDFEDAIQYFSAVDYKKIDVILTRNIKDYKHAQLAVMTADNFLKTYDDALRS